jgi:hypothetical protein
MKKFFALLALIPFLFLFGCEQVQTATTTTSTTTTTYISYFPLIAGRIVTYEVFVHSENPLSHEVIEATTNETWIYRGTTFILGTFEVFRIDVISGNSSDEYYYREDSSGVYKYGCGSAPTTEAGIWIRYPLADGATWESGYIWWPHGFVTQETISTKSGIFTCKKVDLRTMPGSWDYEWFARDVGLIKLYSGYGGVGTSWASCEIVSKNF